MNRQQRRRADREGRVTFASLPGWREVSTEALRRWTGLFDAGDVARFGAWAPAGLSPDVARLDAETVAVGALTCILTAAGSDLVFAGGAGVVDLTGAGARQHVGLVELYALLYLRTSRRPLFGELAHRWAFVIGELDALARLGGPTLREGFRAATEEASARGDA